MQVPVVAENGRPPALHPTRQADAERLRGILQTPLPGQNPSTSTSGQNLTLGAHA